LKEANPQLPQGYLKWLKPLQGYIRKIYNGERRIGTRELHQTYDLISGVERGKSFCCRKISLQTGRLPQRA
jgi:hypothetical protein